MKDARITKTVDGYYDLKLTNGKFETCEDGIEAANLVVIRLLAYKGEYNLGGLLTNKDNLGTDWYGIIFNVEMGQSEKTFEIRRVILQTPGVVSIEELNWEQTGHVVAIQGRINTEWGTVDITQEIETL